MKSEIVVRRNMTLTNEKARNMCRLNYEDNDFLLTTQNGRCIIIDKSKGIIHIEETMIIFKNIKNTFKIFWKKEKIKLF